MLEGNVSIGPICPVERPGVPCPITPEVYTSREVVVYELNEKTLVARTSLDARGHYRLSLPAGEYLLRTKPINFDTTLDHFRNVTVEANKTTTFNFDVDTGIR